MSKSLPPFKVIHLSTEAMRDRLDGNWASDVIHMAEWHDIVFCIDQTSGVGSGEVSVQRVDDTTPTSTAGCPGGRYSYSTSVDTWSEWTDISTSSGFVTSITPDKTYLVHVNSDEIGGTSGWEYVRINIDEVTNSPVELNVTAWLFNPRHGVSDRAPTVLT